VRVIGLPASRGSIGQEVKDRGSAARPRVRREAAKAMTLGEKYIVRKERKIGVGF
jgi:hypothetical protein